MQEMPRTAWRRFRRATHGLRLDAVLGFFVQTFGGVSKGSRQGPSSASGFCRQPIDGTGGSHRNSCADQGSPRRRYKGSSTSGHSRTATSSVPPLSPKAWPGGPISDVAVSHLSWKTATAGSAGACSRSCECHRLLIAGIRFRTLVNSEPYTRAGICRDAIHEEHRTCSR